MDYFVVFGWEFVVKFTFVIHEVFCNDLLELDLEGILTFFKEIALRLDERVRFGSSPVPGGSVSGPSVSTASTLKTPVTADDQRQFVQEEGLQNPYTNNAGFKLARRALLLDTPSEWFVRQEQAYHEEETF